MFKKIIIALFCVLIIVSVFATSFVSADNDNFKTQPFEGKDSKNAGKSIVNMGGSVLNVVRVVAIGIGLIMLSVLGMKYMLASPNDRAEIKGSAIRYVLGAVLMFSASAIMTIIQRFTENSLPTAE